MRNPEPIGATGLGVLHISHAEVEQAVREFVERRAGFEVVEVIVSDSYWRTRCQTDAIVKFAEPKS